MRTRGTPELEHRRMRVAHEREHRIAGESPRPYRSHWMSGREDDGVPRVGVPCRARHHLMVPNEIVAMVQGQSSDQARWENRRPKLVSGESADGVGREQGGEAPS